MAALLADPQAWLAFITLTVLEIVLGVDNLIFIALLVGRLPEHRREAARIVGLSLAMLTRIALLFSIVWLTRLVQPWFHIATLPVSGRDLVLLAGGLFLLVQSVIEIRHTLQKAAPEVAPRRMYTTFLPTVLQIGLIDIVFSLDSVFTAVGLVRELPIMVAAIVAAILLTMWMSRPVSALIDRHPTLKLLALSFLVLVAVALLAQAVHLEIPKGYLYFAMAFAVVVESLNIRLRRRTERGKPAAKD